MPLSWQRGRRRLGDVVGDVFLEDQDEVDAVVADPLLERLHQGRAGPLVGLPVELVELEELAEGPAGVLAGGPADHQDLPAPGLGDQLGELVAEGRVFLDLGVLVADPVEVLAEDAEVAAGDELAVAA